MKRVLSLLSIFILVISLMGCSNSKEIQKSEDEIRAEIKAELEAELEAEKNKEIENEIASQEEKQEEVNKESAKQTGAVDENQKTSTNDILIETNGSNYYKYKANELVAFDLDGDGSEEKIKYNTINGKLEIGGYEAIDIDITSPSLEKDHFIIIKFSDKFNTKMNMIGILDYGPSADYLTTLYSIVEPMGEKCFVSVGMVTAEIVLPEQYDENNDYDFNYKAVLIENEGIEAPVRLSVLPQTWFGRNLFTYYSTYVSLIDSIYKYETDYVTKSELKVEKDIIAYSEKDLNSNNIIIKAGQRVKLVATDNSEWIKLYTKEGAGGWVCLSEITSDSFSDYTCFD